MGLEFRFAQPDKQELMPYYMEVTVWENGIGDLLDELMSGAAKALTFIPPSRQVGNLYMTQAGENEWEVWDSWGGNPNDMPVHYLKDAKDFPNYVMFEIPEAAWKGVR